MAPEPTDVVRVSGDTQTGLAGVPLRDSLVVRVTGDGGAPLEGVTVRWERNGGTDRLLSPAITETDGQGRAMALWRIAEAGEAPDTVRARLDDGLEVAFTATARRAEPDTEYTGRAGYVEYHAGSLPIIVSAPHGGTRDPSEIPDRTQGTMVRDLHTDLVARDVVDAFEDLTGQRPHLVITTLHRRKVDLNREIVEAAQGHPLGEQVWHEFQGAIEHARDRVEEAWGRGLFLDLHGHGHEIQRLELGYLLNGSELSRDDETLDTGGFASESSIRALAQRSATSFSTLLRGPGSLGTRFEARGYPAVPSEAQPDPGGAPFFSGGYNTRRHGSRAGGSIDGVQIETHFEGARDTGPNRRAYARAIAEVALEFVEAYYGVDIPAGAPLR
jgi:hypothetical protein